MNIRLLACAKILLLTGALLALSNCTSTSSRLTRSGTSYGESSEREDEIRTETTYRSKYVSSNNRIGGAHQRANDNVTEAQRRFGGFNGSSGFTSAQNSTTGISSNFGGGNTGFQGGVGTGNTGVPSTAGQTGGGGTAGSGTGSALGINLPGVNINLPGGLGL